MVPAIYGMDDEGDEDLEDVSSYRGPIPSLGYYGDEIKKKKPGDKVPMKQSKTPMRKKCEKQGPYEPQGMPEDRPS